MKKSRKFFYGSLSVLLLLLLCEAIARIFLYGFPQAPFIVKEGPCSKIVYNFHLNQHKPDIIVPKPEDEFRVMVFGESAADGWLANGFSLWMERLLAGKTNEKRVKVYNLAVPSTHSSIIRDWYFPAMNMQPDLVVIYMGNNEIDWYSPINPLKTPRLYKILSFFREHSRLYIAVKGGFELQSKLFMPIGEDLMYGMAASEDLVISDELRDKSLALFLHNLKDMIEGARNAGARLVLVRPAANLSEWPPVKSTHHDGLDNGSKTRFDSFLKKAEINLSKDAFEATEVLLNEALSIDHTYAEAWFLLAKAQAGRGKQEQSYRSFQKAREWEDFFMRSPASYGKELSSLAEETGVHYIDLDLLLARKSDKSAAGFDIFMDGYHFKPYGNYLFASTLIRDLGRAGLVPVTEEELLEYGTLKNELMPPPRFAHYRFNRALLLSIIAGEREEVLREGIAAFDEVSESSPGDPMPLLYKACLASRLNAKDLAAGALTEAYSLGPYVASSAAARFFTNILDIYQGQAILSLENVRWSRVARRVENFRKRAESDKLTPPSFGTIEIEDATDVYMWSDEMNRFMKISPFVERKINECTSKMDIEPLSINVLKTTGLVSLQGMVEEGDGKYRSTSRDPEMIIRLPPKVSGCGLSVMVSGSIEMEGDESNWCSLYWSWKPSPDFREQEKVVFEWPADGKPRDFTLPLKRIVPVLAGPEITFIRLDFASGPAFIRLSELRVITGD